MIQMPVASFQEKRTFQVNRQRVVIRQARREEDAPELRQRLARVIRERVYLDETPDSLPDSQEQKEEIKQIQDAGGMYAVVKVDGIIAGTAQLRKGSRGVSDHTATFRTWLIPGYRGMGLGKKLMEYTIDWAQDNNLEKINLDVWSNNERAIRLYRKYGFRLEGNRRRQGILNGEYVDEIFMSRFL
ncbi:RimJ/RimL family protein N-acetyltransferase [Kroppenstedtia sanguinis]|uniref:GNAT family N-acetyltransferase n=1 Tax=Kroppenstedtia sanguinis TaxID=1380684 RepID=UPI003D1B5CF6